MTADTLTAARQFASLPEAARWCGMSERSLRRLTLARKIKTYRPTPDGRRVVVDLAELAEYVRSTADDATTAAPAQTEE